MSLLDPYYDYHPTFALPRPVVLTGFLGAGVVEVAGILSQRTGLPVVDLDRWVEHDQGRSLGELVFFQGEDALRQAEKRLLPRALRERPVPIIALGDATLIDPECRARVLREADLIYLREDLGALLLRVRAEIERNRASLYPFLRSSPDSVEALAGLFDDRRLGYEAAERTIDVNGRSTGAVAAELLEIIRR